jgi:hypothetical protein
MAGRWDDIEILRAIDRLQHERFGDCSAMVGHGLWLMEEINGGTVFERQHAGAC